MALALWQVLCKANLSHGSPVACRDSAVPGRRCVFNCVPSKGPPQPDRWQPTSLQELRRRSMCYPAAPLVPEGDCWRRKLTWVRSSVCKLRRQAVRSSCQLVPLVFPAPGKSRNKSHENQRLVLLRGARGGDILCLAPSFVQSQAREGRGRKETSAGCASFLHQRVLRTLLTSGIHYFH